MELLDTDPLKPQSELSGFFSGRLDFKKGNPRSRASLRKLEAVIQRTLGPGWALALGATAFSSGEVSSPFLKVTCHRAVDMSHVTLYPCHRAVGTDKLSVGLNGSHSGGQWTRCPVWSPNPHMFETLMDRSWEKSPNSTVFCLEGIQGSSRGGLLFGP